MLKGQKKILSNRFSSPRICVTSYKISFLFFFSFTNKIIIFHILSSFDVMCINGNKKIICEWKNILIVYNSFFLLRLSFHSTLPFCCCCCCWFFKSWVKIIFWEFKMADSRWKFILQIFTFLIRFMCRNFYSFIVNYFYEKSFIHNLFH